MTVNQHGQGYRPGAGAARSIGRMAARAAGGQDIGRQAATLAAQEAARYGMSQVPNLWDSTSGNFTTTGNIAASGVGRGIGAALGGADAGQVAEEAAWGAGNQAVTQGISSQLGASSTPYVGWAVGLGERALRNDNGLRGRDVVRTGIPALASAANPIAGIASEIILSYMDTNAAKNKKHNLQYDFAEGGGPVRYENGKFIPTRVTGVNGKRGGKLGAYQSMYAEEIARRANERMQNDPEYRARTEFLSERGQLRPGNLINYTSDELDDIMSAETVDDLRKKAQQNADRFFGEGGQRWDNHEQAAMHYADQQELHSHRSGQDAVSEYTSALDDFYGYQRNVPKEFRGKLSNQEYEAYKAANEKFGRMSSDHGGQHVSLSPEEYAALEKGRSALRDNVNQWGGL